MPAPYSTDLRQRVIDAYEAKEGSQRLIAIMSISGSVNTDVFVTYVREILAPQLWTGAIVVMDNLSVHTQECDSRLN